MIPLYIVGAGSHGKGMRLIVDDINSNLAQKGLFEQGYSFEGFLDDDSSKDDVVGPVNMKAEGSFVLGINNSKQRYDISKRVRVTMKGELWPARLIHPSSLVGHDCKIGYGAVLHAGTILTGDVCLGEHTHVNVGATVSQGSRVGSFTTLSPGVHIAGEVTVGDRVHIGTSAAIVNLIKIEKDSTIGAGAVVIRDLNDSGVYVGIPARKVEPKVL